MAEKNPGKVVSIWESVDTAKFIGRLEDTLIKDRLRYEATEERLEKQRTSGDLVPLENRLREILCDLYGRLRWSLVPHSVSATEQNIVFKVDTGLDGLGKREFWLPIDCLSMSKRDIAATIANNPYSTGFVDEVGNAAEPPSPDVLASDVFQDVADRLSALMQRNKTEPSASSPNYMTDAEIRDMANQFSASFEKNKTEPASTIDEMSQYFTKRGIKFWIEEDDKETRLVRKFDGLVPMHFVYTWPKD